jgi:benzoyl-CoA reductase/2-hydroxyglutaryl-CoA dehydratase subunit BcrC/BadD/HgdB
MVHEYRAAAVVSYVLPFCDPYAVEAYREEKTLKAEDIPLLRIETDYSQHDTGQLKTRIEAFLEILANNAWVAVTSPNP